ncbi:hypothetical protein [Streptomyces sp. NBC_00459]|uniref:hypothetical protein n=1 Tax=Streptomyces sp. NBC_00459 TaxID=2975749 RepID=UPI002E17282F
MTTVQTPAEADTSVRLCVPLDNVAALIDREFQGPWFTVGREKLPVFDDATYADQNAHAFDDDNYAENLVEGFHLLALLDHLTNDLVAAEGDRWYAVNYGLDRVRFVTPVQAGVPIRVHGSVAEVRPKGKGHLLLLRIAVEVRGAERPGFTADQWVLWLPTDDVEARETQRVRARQETQEVQTQRSTSGGTT